MSPRDVDTLTYDEFEMLCRAIDEHNRQQTQTT